MSRAQSSRAGQLRGGPNPVAEGESAFLLTREGDDREMLEDLVAAAINAAVHRVAEKAQESMAGLTSGMGLPPGLKLPF